MVLAQWISDILMMVMIWVFILFTYFIFRFMQRYRQEHARFLTVEPQFQQFDEQYNLPQNSSPTLLGSIFNRLNPNDSHSITLKLKENSLDLKMCRKCGAYTYIDEFFCIICGHNKFIKNQKNT